MPRPIKDPDQRQRRNKAVTAATLVAGDDQVAPVKIPPLNAELLGIKGAVKPQVKRWWGEVWRSPMAPRWLKSDVEVLYLCALLHHQVAVAAFEGKSVATLAGELRQQESRLGLDVLARRRLDWRIEGPRQAPPAVEAEAPAEPDEPEEIDPRQVLRAVK